MQVAEGNGGGLPHHARMSSQLPQVGRLTVSNSGRSRIAGLALRLAQSGPYAAAGGANELDGEVPGADRPSQGAKLVLVQGLVVLGLEDGERPLDAVENVLVEVAVRQLGLKTLLQVAAPAAHHKPARVLRNLLGDLGDALALSANDLGQGASTLALLVHRALVSGREPDADDIVVPSLARLELLDAPRRACTALPLSPCAPH